VHKTKRSNKDLLEPINNRFKIAAEVWIYGDDLTGSTNAAAMRGSWYFVTVPKKTSEIINNRFGSYKRGWGSLPVEVIVGKTKWRTSIFPDRKIEAYLLPIKASVRKQEKIDNKDRLELELKILVD